MRATDKAILALLAKRLKTAQRIGAAKRKRGLPVRNYDLEADVIRDARALCKRYRIDPALGEDVMRTLIRAAVQAQENHKP
jgi:chorismate mutase